GLRREISSNDLFIQVNSHRARTRILAYGPADNGIDKADRKARCRSVFEPRTFRIDQNDAAVTPAGSSFDEPTDCFKYFGHRTAARNHFQQPSLTGEQSFSLLPVVDVRLQHVPTSDTILGALKRQSAN